MPFEAAVILAIFLITTALIALMALLSRRHMRAKEDEIRRAASTRGWTFQAAVEKGYRIHRWSGTTDGISWTAESLRHQGGNKGSRRRHIARWHGTFSPGIAGAIVAMGVPKGKERLGTAIAEGEGWVAKLAQKAAGFAFDKAIDIYFGEAPGKEIDAAALHRVDGERIPGFIVMAATKDEGTRILSQGFEKALTDAVNEPSSILSEEDRPWVLLRPNTVSLARMETYRDVAELERFIRAGVALTRAFKFGRPIS
jgi:hypothetical protein